MLTKQNKTTNKTKHKTKQQNQNHSLESQNHCLPSPRESGFRPHCPRNCPHRAVGGCRLPSWGTSQSFQWDPLQLFWLILPESPPGDGGEGVLLPWFSAAPEAAPSSSVSAGPSAQSCPLHTGGPRAQTSGRFPIYSDPVAFSICGMKYHLCVPSSQTFP